MFTWATKKRPKTTDMLVIRLYTHVFRDRVPTLFLQSGHEKVGNNRLVE